MNRRNPGVAKRAEEPKVDERDKSYEYPAYLTNVADDTVQMLINMAIIEHEESCWPT